MSPKLCVELQPGSRGAQPGHSRPGPGTPMRFRVHDGPRVPKHVLCILGPVSPWALRGLQNPSKACFGLMVPKICDALGARAIIL